MPGDEAVPRRPLYLSAADCRKLLTPEAIVRSIEETLLWDTEGGVRWSDPRSMRMSDRLGTQYHLKACVLEPALVAGVRLVAHQSDEARGTATRWIIVLDAATALPLAIVDETWTYAQRTVAVMAVAAQRLASRGRVLALVGASRLAAAALTYYKHLFDLSEVRIASRRPETRAALAGRARQDMGLAAVAADSVETAVRGADQVLTCTSSGREILSDAWVGPGAVVASLDTAEPGADLVRRADLLVVDSREQLEGELAECFGPDVPGRVDATISEVLAGRHPGRTSPEQRIVVISQGLASLDVALAYRAYDLALAQGLGSRLPFEEAPIQTGRGGGWRPLWR